jgi:hypothetical protein
VEDLWNDSPESIELMPGSEDTWSLIEQESPLPYVVQHGTELLATRYSDFSHLRPVGAADQCVLEQQYPLSPTVLYQDLTQKYSAVLEMCESPRNCLQKLFSNKLI